MLFITALILLIIFAFYWSRTIKTANLESCHDITHSRLLDNTPNAEKWYWSGWRDCLDIDENPFFESYFEIENAEIWALKVKKMQQLTHHFVLSPRPQPQNNNTIFRKTREGGLHATQTNPENIYFRQFHAMETNPRILQLLEKAAVNGDRISISGAIRWMDYDDTEIQDFAQFNGFDKGNQCPCVTITRIQTHSKQQITRKTTACS